MISGFIYDEESVLTMSHIGCHSYSSGGFKNRNSFSLFYDKMWIPKG